MFVCLYVCMFVCLYVCMYVRIVRSRKGLGYVYVKIISSVYILPSYLVVEFSPGHPVEVEPLQLDHQHGRHAPQLEPLAHVLVASAFRTHHSLDGLGAGIWMKGYRDAELQVMIGDNLQVIGVIGGG